MSSPSSALAARTPRELIDAVLRNICSCDSAQVVRVTTGGLNETYEASLIDGPPVIVRIARRSQPWFTQEAALMARARSAGVPTPEVLGVEHVEHQGALLSFSVLQKVLGRSLEERRRASGRAGTRAFGNGLRDALGTTPRGGPQCRHSARALHARNKSHCPRHKYRRTHPRFVRRDGGRTRRRFRRPPTPTPRRTPEVTGPRRLAAQTLSD